MKIKVKNLVANPYRNIEVYPIDQEKIRQLRNSIRETTFWDNILARPAPGNGQYQIAYGHHRLVAIKEELGEDITIDIPVRELSDENMLRIMANENMEQWSTDWSVIVETVRQTRKFLEGHSEVAKEYGAHKGGALSIGTRVISRFLGENWSETRISRALRIMEDKQIQSISLEGRRKEISLNTLELISYLKNENVKKQWLEQIIPKEIRIEEMQEITRFENDPILSDCDKKIIREKILEGRTRGKDQIIREITIKKLLSQPKKQVYISIPEGKYRTIVIDPAWPMDKILREVRPNQIKLDYPTMSLEEIETLSIPKLAYQDGCHIYLWTTHKYLPDAFKILNAWDAKYECLLTWVKNVGITPFSWMYSTEHCLFARIGSLPLMKLGRRLDFRAAVREHSRKPDEFYNLVKEISPRPRIDMFSREEREGFTQYGNEVDKFSSKEVVAIS